MLENKPNATDPTDIVVRLRFARVEPAIWLAHLDLMRTFERSIRRAELPVAYSKGFNPRPHLAFALPIATGLATRDDYVDIYLTETVDPNVLLARLNRCLPTGLSILAAQTVSGVGPSLMSLIQAADYRFEGRGLAAAAERMLAMSAELPWTVEKNSKGKQVTVDIRPLLVASQPDGPDGLTVRFKAGSKDNLRPDIFLAALVRHGGLDATDAADTAVTRTRLLIESHSVPPVLQSPLPLPDER